MQVHTHEEIDEILHADHVQGPISEDLLHKCSQVTIIFVMDCTYHRPTDHSCEGQLAVESIRHQFLLQAQKSRDEIRCLCLRADLTLLFALANGEEEQQMLTLSQVLKLLSDVSQNNRLQVFPSLTGANEQQQDVVLDGGVPQQLVYSLFYFLPLFF